jgi:glycosidase
MMRSLALCFAAAACLLASACGDSPTPGATTPTAAPEAVPTSTAGAEALPTSTKFTLKTVTPAPDLPGQAGDRRVDEGALFHDSDDPFYRDPGGSVPGGTVVTLRLKTAPGDLTAADVRLWNSRTESEELLPMTSTAPDTWEAKLETGEEGTPYWYRFVARDGLARSFYSDDDDLDGGTGQARSFETDKDYALVAYDPDFVTPEWVRDGVVYQIFPDRFNNGDPSNDKPAGSFIYGGQTQSRAWGDKPTGGDDFFGGDLQGVIDKLDYLQSLGVTAIWFNPIFTAPSNHRYDTTDYTTIEPSLGTLDTFRELVTEARERGIRIILDGVFNHSSSDSLYFDKFARYDSQGAFESQESPYFGWYTFSAWPEQYNSWFNIDTLPAYTENEAVRNFFFHDAGSITRQWTKEGASWRLDAAEQKSHSYWRDARLAIKDTNPDAVIIGEFWQNSAPWLAGDQWDGTMNYRFKDAVLSWLTGPLPNVEKTVNQLAVIREQYPPQALAASMNIIGSHDTVRALTEARGDKNLLMLMALMQFTSPGMPTIYYGDEAGLEGNRDPDDRRTYPWGAEDPVLVEFYKLLSATRHEWSSLRTGEYFDVAYDQDKNFYAYARRDDTGYALVVVNRNEADQELELPVANIIPDGTVLDDRLNTGRQYTAQGGVIKVSVGAKWGVLLVGK